jgi:hypothetical protein
VILLIRPFPAVISQPVDADTSLYCAYERARTHADAAAAAVAAAAIVVANAMPITPMAASAYAAALDDDVELNKLSVEAIKTATLMAARRCESLRPTDGSGGGVGTCQRT